MVEVSPLGVEVKDHKYVNVFPSASELPVPFKVIVALTVATPSSPAFATGAILGGAEKVTVSV